MKRYFFFLFFLAGLNATAQHALVRQSVEDDGQNLSVAFDFSQRGTLRHFQRRFEVPNWSKAQKQTLLRHLVDSLGLPPEAADVALLDDAVPADAEPLAALEPAAAAVPVGEARRVVVPRTPCAPARTRNARTSVVVP
jgi:hypothetical protein